LEQSKRLLYRENIELHSIQRIFIAGASVPPNLLKKLSKIAPEAEVFTPYGATEGLPLTNVSAKEILTLCEKTDRGEGFCVGRPVTQHEIKIIRITDDPIPHWSEDLEVQNGVVGEICVKGGVVTNSYFKDEYHNRLTKIQDKNGFWHRMGDLDIMIKNKDCGSVVESHIESKQKMERYILIWLKQFSISIQK
jgi:acyl-CoA synthetase (AMP-forming)/AMP-acid ligase II